MLVQKLRALYRLWVVTCPKPRPPLSKGHIPFLWPHSPPHPSNKPDGPGEQFCSILQRPELTQDSVAQVPTQLHPGEVHFTESSRLPSLCQAVPKEAASTVSLLSLWNNYSHNCEARHQEDILIFKLIVSLRPWAPTGSPDRHHSPLTMIKLVVQVQKEKTNISFSVIQFPLVTIILTVWLYYFPHGKSILFIYFWDRVDRLD